MYFVEVVFIGCMQIFKLRVEEKFKKVHGEVVYSKRDDRSSSSALLVLLLHGRLCR